MSSESDEKRIVELYDTVGTSLILRYPTGITYTNQAGGTSCLQPSTDGVLIPFGNDYGEDGKFISLELELAKYFDSEYGGTGATNGITHADADTIERVLEQHQLNTWIAVDRDMLQSSFEAWINVLVLSDHACYCRGFDPYPRSGVLTWANSD